ncbi:MAG: hypothetical protein ACYDCD_10170 [Candidatus Acidiferrales bacterium]
MRRKIRAKRSRKTLRSQPLSKRFRRQRKRRLHKPDSQRNHRQRRKLPKRQFNPSTLCA